MRGFGFATPERVLPAGGTRAGCPRVFRAAIGAKGETMRKSLSLLAIGLFVVAGQASAGALTSASFSF